MTELNGCDPIKIKVLGPYTFSIGDTTNFSEYIRGGIVTQVKMPKTLNFKSYEEADKDPSFLMSDFAKFDYPSSLHSAYTALHQFIEAEGREPRPWNEEDANKLLELTKALNADINEGVVKTFAKVCVEIGKKLLFPPMIIHISNILFQRMHY